MLEKTARLLLIVLMTVIALSVLCALAAMVALSLVLLIVAVITAYCLAPEKAKTFWRLLAERLDDWILRFETLWAEIKSVVEHFTSSPSADANPAQTATQRPETPNAASDASPVSDEATSGAEAPNELSVVPIAEKRESR